MHDLGLTLWHSGLVAKHFFVTSAEKLRRTLVEKIALMKTRFAILILIVIAFFTSGTPIQAQYLYPPLTQQCTDAYLEWYFFFVGQVVGVKPYTPSAQERLQFAQYVAAGYPRLAPAQKEFWLNMPVLWATFRRQWSYSSEEQKEITRLFWRQQIVGSAAYGTQWYGFASGSSNASSSQAINELNRRMQSAVDLQNFTTRMTDSKIDLMHAMSGHR